MQYLSDLLLIKSVLSECFDLAMFCLFAGCLFRILSCHGVNCVVARGVLEEVFAELNFLSENAFDAFLLC